MTDFRGPTDEMTPEERSELRLTLESDFKPGARIKVIGVGGGGSNADRRFGRSRDSEWRRG